MPRKLKSTIPLSSAITTRSFLGQPFYDDVCVTFAYEVEVAASTSFGAYTYQMRANSLNDPDYTSIGSQPLAFDQWAAFYNKYTVYHMSYDVSLSSLGSGGSSITLTLATCYSTNSTPFATPEVASVQRRGQSTVASSFGTPARLRGGEPVSTTFGVKPFVVESDDSFSALTTADPVNSAYLNINIESSNAGTAAFLLRIKIYMKARMWKGVIGTLSLHRIKTDKALIEAYKKSLEDKPPPAGCPSVETRTSCGCACSH